MWFGMICFDPTEVTKGVKYFGLEKPQFFLGVFEFEFEFESPDMIMYLLSESCTTRTLPPCLGLDRVV